MDKIVGEIVESIGEVVNFCVKAPILILEKAVTGIWFVITGFLVPMVGGFFALFLKGCGL